MEAFLISVLSGLIATALYEALRSPVLRARIAEMWRRGPDDVGTPARPGPPLWLGARLVILALSAFLGGALVAGIAESGGHPQIALGSQPHVMLAALTGLAGWTASATARRLGKVTVSIAFAAVFTLLVFKPYLLSVRESGAEPLTLTLTLVLAYIGCLAALDRIPALRARRGGG